VNLTFSSNINHRTVVVIGFSAGGGRRWMVTRPPPVKMFSTTDTMLMMSAPEEGVAKAVHVKNGSSTLTRSSSSALMTNVKGRAGEKHQRQR